MQVVRQQDGDCVEGVGVERRVERCERRAACLGGELPGTVRVIVDACRHTHAGHVPLDGVEVVARDGAAAEDGEAEVGLHGATIPAAVPVAPPYVR